MTKEQATFFIKQGVREETVEAYLVRRVKKLGGAIRKVSWPGHRGAPDRAVFLPGVRTASLVWVELKAPGKKAEAHQLREHAKLQEYGQEVLVLDSKDAVDNWLGAEKCE